jgi:hypothetical protein
MPAHSIEDVLARIDAIVDRARREESRVGYFAALYRNVTASVQRGIVNGRFEDGTRMARLDVVFANRYLDAVEAFRASRPISRSWRIAFEAADSWPPLVLQHLMLGMNAHIMLDLGIAAAETAPGSALPALERDFVEINRLLAEMVDDVQRRVAHVSPWMHVLDALGQRTDESLCGYCVGRARELSWGVARRLAPLDGAAREREIAVLDAVTAALALPIRTPPPTVRAALLGVRLRETADVSQVIDALDGRRH